MSGWDLSDYKEVSERIDDFREKHPEGTLQSEVIPSPFDSFVIVKAYAYRSPDDPRPGVGLAWEPVPGKTPYTKDSELMNAETSAWGRAIVAVGASDAKKVASANEVRNRQDSPEGTQTVGSTPPARQPPAEADPELQGLSPEEVWARCVAENLCPECLWRDGRAEELAHDPEDNKRPVWSCPRWKGDYQVVCPNPGKYSWGTYKANLADAYDEWLAEHTDTQEKVETGEPREGPSAFLPPSEAPDLTEAEWSALYDLADAWVPADSPNMDTIRDNLKRLDALMTKAGLWKPDKGRSPLYAALHKHHEVEHLSDLKRKEMEEFAALAQAGAREKLKEVE